MMDVESRRPNRFGRPRTEGPTVIRPLPTFCLLVAAAFMAPAALPGRAADDGAAAQGEEPGAGDAGEVRSPGAGPSSQQVFMAERGLVRYRGAWRTSQEIALIERSERETVAQKQWGPRLEKLRRRLDDPATSATAAEELRERPADGGLA
jgi:hypothetical protein